MAQHTFDIVQKFEFKSKTKTFLIALMVLGLICLGINFFTDDGHHTRFWSNVLLNTVFFTGISLMALFFYAANIVALSGWYTGFKRVWEALYGFLPFGLIIMAVIGVGTMVDFHDLYHWAIESEVAKDELMQHKSGFLNSGWYMLATVGFGLVWFVIGMIIRNLSKKEDQVGSMEFTQHKKMRVWAAIFLPFGGFTVAAAVWLWVMSVDPHWYSTLFAWYGMISWLVSMLAITILIMVFLKSYGYFQNVTKEHLHDLGKYLFAFSIFWTYLWFSQYMLIWYGNVGEETIYFRHRMDNYPVLFYANLIINFLVPFFILMRNDTKRKYGTLTFTAIVVFFGHWLDYFLMLKPGILHTAHAVSGHGHGDGHSAEAAHDAGHHVSNFVAGFTMPGLIEIGIFAGFLGAFLFVFFTRLSNAKLVPSKDPYLEESLHHHA